MNEKITLTECELVVDDISMPQINTFQNKHDIYELDGIAYDIVCEVIDEKLLWIYAKYGKAKPYDNQILNIETKEYSNNPRTPDDVEMRNQIFCIYSQKIGVLYMSDFRKSRVIEKYLRETFQRDFTIRKYVVNLETFVNEVDSIKSLKFVSVDEHLFNSGIFDEVRDVCGFGSDDGIVSVSMEVKVTNKQIDKSKWRNILNSFKTKKEKREIDKMICVGKDDKNIEKIFNLDTFLKKIQIPATKDKNEMYDPEKVKKSILEQLDV